MTTDKVNWFSIRFALIGAPIDVIRAEIADIQEELEMRPHLENPSVYWEPEHLCAIIEVDYPGFSADRRNREGFDEARRVADIVAEELAELGSAVLGDFEEYRVEILDVHLRTS